MTVTDIHPGQTPGSHGASDFSEREHDVLTAKGVATHKGARLMLFDTWKRTGLDPFTGQIYLANRQGTMKVETTIDGMRTVAEKHGQYAGQDGPYWCGPDGKWVDVWLEQQPPVAAKVGILRTDFKQPLYATARFSDFAAYKKDGSLNPFWKKMGPHMIAKVAEALGFRRAFPQDLSGLYTSDEMQQADKPEPQPEQRPAPEIPAEPKVTAERMQKHVAAALATATADEVKIIGQEARGEGATQDQLNQLLEIWREKVEAESEITDKEIADQTPKAEPLTPEEDAEMDDGTRTSLEDTGRHPMYSRARAALNRQGAA